MRQGESTAVIDATPVGGVVDDRRAGIANLRSHTARGMLVNGVFQVGMIAVSALRGLIVAAFLTRADYGLWGIVGLTLWTALGFKTIFGASDKYIQQSDADQEQAFQRAFTVELIFAAAVAPVAAASVVVLASVTGHPAVLAPGFALLALLPSVALQFPIAILYRRMDYRRQRLLQSIEPVGGAVVMIVLAVLGAGYWSFVGGALAGSWAGALAALHSSPYRLRWRYDRGTLGGYIRFSMPLLVSGVAQLGLFQVIYLVGVGPLGLAGLGAFTLVGNLVQFTDQADNIVTETLYPAVCAVSDRIGLQSEIFIKSNRLSLMWAVPFGVGMTLFGADLLRFGLGTHWLPALGLLQIMGIVTAVNHLGYNWSAFIKSRGETWPIAWSAAAVSIVVIAAGIPLMYSDGVIGLGYAFVIGTVVSLAIRAYFMHRFFEGAGLLRHAVRAFGPTLVAIVPVLGLRAAAGGEDSLSAALLVFALYVAGTVVATAALERPLLREAFGYLLSRRPQVA
jgi:O-antigen/teichoic acid export membrane protein